jgi:hypothetical protein
MKSIIGSMMLAFAVGCSSMALPAEPSPKFETVKQQCDAEATAAAAKAAACKVEIPANYASDYSTGCDSADITDGSILYDTKCSDMCVRDVSAMLCTDLKYLPAPSGPQTVGRLTLPNSCFSCQEGDTCPTGTTVACPCANGKHGTKMCGASDSACTNCT